MGSVGWLRAAAPGSAPPPTNKLGLCSESVCQASDRPRGVEWGGGEHRGAADLGAGDESWVRAGAARGSSLPAGRGRPRGSVWGQCAGCLAHLQRLAWKRAARPAVSPGRTLAAARPPESRLPGMAGGRQRVVASLLKPPRFVHQPCCVPPGSKGTSESIGSSVSIGIPFASAAGDLQAWPRAQGRCPPASAAG